MPQPQPGWFDRQMEVTRKATNQWPRWKRDAAGLGPADPDAVHAWFGLTYSAYLVLPRSVMQAMPDDWQHQMVALLEEAGEKFGHLYDDEYMVKRRHDGKFVTDPLANYRHPVEELIPRPWPKPSSAPAIETGQR